jgi:hypothetical protein
VTVLPVSEQPKGKVITLAPRADGANKTGISAYASLTVDGKQSASGIRVTFTLSDPDGKLIKNVPGLTNSGGGVHVTLVPSGLANGLYTVTATADGYASDSQRVRIGPTPPTYSENAGSGCSAGLSPLLLVAAIALMGWTSKRR